MLTQMRSGLAMLMIEKALVEAHFAWGPDYYHGLARNKVPVPYLQQKKNMWLSHHVALNLFG